MFTKIIRYIFTVFAVVISMPAAKSQINAEQVMRVGQNALYFEDYMLSIQYFNQAIQAKPYLAQPYFMRAIAKLNLEDYLGAEQDATAAIERNPFIADAYEVRGVARQNRGLLRGAVEDYDNALNLIPKSRGLLFNKAIAQQELKLIDEALETFNTLLASYPGYENGYIGRARLLLERKDTVGAKADVDKALSLNKNLPGAYLLRADIAINSHKNYENAYEDISEAIKLQPLEAGLYVNRAFLRYNLDDYFGAMADYDYALQLDPLNVAAIFNRGLLRMEVRDNDNAIKDFTKVLELAPDDYRALYNRAYLYSEKHDVKHAMDDINRLVEAFPELPEALYMRSNLHRLSGNMALAEKDYNKALALSKSLRPASETTDGGNATGNGVSPSATGDTELTNDAVARRFAALRTVDNPVDVEEEYNNKNIRGRVQDRSRRIELVQLTNADIALSDEDIINRHFKSIEYYNSYIATHTPRAIDYFGRAMDFMMLRDYASAVEDLNKALNLTPDFALGYFARGVARYKSFMANAGNNTVVAPRQAEIRAIIGDFDKALELSPRLSFAYYNKGNVLAELGDYTSALMAFNKAIELKPDFGEAYYNRGYVYFQLGDRDKGSLNLSKAGELGIMPSYNLLKRMH